MATSYIPKYHDLNVTFTPDTPDTPEGSYSTASAATGSTTTFAAAADSAAQQATVHYIEAGDPTSPTMLLLHGFPSSSYEYRDLIPLLSDRYHVLAPDMPGFGLTRVPASFQYTFANLATVIAAWLTALNVLQTALYVHDYGAPVGLRLASSGRLNVSALVTQNGNAYIAGFGQDFWAPIFALWNSSNSPDARQAVAQAALTLEATREQYTVGTAPTDLALLDPSAWTFNYLQNLAGTANTQNQLDLFYDYRTNVAMYPTFQRWIRESKVPVLAVWGKGDPAFIPAGAEAYKADAPDAVVRFVDAGHFALESRRWEIARIMRWFLDGVGY